MQISSNKKIVILTVIAICMAIFYLLVGLDFEIFEYQFQSRLKKFILILLVGGAIGTSVVIFQAITTNRLLTPSIMGLDSVYLFVKVLPVFLLSEQATIVTNVYLNFLITLVAMVLFSLLLFQGIFKLGNFSVYFILLVGVILGTFFRSITSFLQLIMNPDSFLAVQSAMFASFEAANSNLVVVSGILLIILIIITIILRPYLDVLLLGKAQAINLGVSYDKMTRILLIMVALLVSISTALIGPVTFLGLLTVNLAHEFMKTYEHKYILPATILFSWISLFIAQWVVENLFEATSEFSLIVDLVGGSYFIYLLVKRRSAN
ncbi:iron ABC transporter permease [Staphylococcus pragensis]|uniref:Iron ABC transporter permease n=1 Tax=Staphylococcus pragensis TaxID=1611836 RepID=A0A4Z1C7D0_9STAP|nr:MULTISPECIES: iron chelate uptake ABC transporter family permease subunit [Staphylococcus]RTX90608.1 iron ABC transporter permease [Staphylococcus carnosus]TGN28181.1 iron ABC transporter permease [Staphylococcus pragensis]GGG89395.1 iron ABC transporter permease [Staphylococcus pragensis]